MIDLEEAELTQEIRNLLWSAACLQMDAMTMSRSKLHGLLWTVAEPWIDSPVQPVGIGWYRHPNPNPRDGTHGRARLQYGARAWSTMAYPRYEFLEHEDIAPRYQRALNCIAVILRTAKWEVLSWELLFNRAKPSLDMTNDMEMMLVIEDGQCRFGIRDRSSRTEAHFLVERSGLVTVPRLQSVWFDAYPQQYDPPLVEPSWAERYPNRKDREDVKRRLVWSHATPLMQPDEAAHNLGGLLRGIFDRLSRLGSCVAIGTSPQRFNDAYYDINWMKVMVDGAQWDNMDYFSRSATAALTARPNAIHEAIGLLHDVLKYGVRKRFADYLGNPSVGYDVMVLSVDVRGRFIGFSDSNGCDGLVFAVDAESGLPSIMGATSNLDDRFWEVTPDKGDTAVERFMKFIPIDDWLALIGGEYEPIYEVPALVGLDFRGTYDEFGNHWIELFNDRHPAIAWIDKGEVTVSEKQNDIHMI